MSFIKARRSVSLPQRLAFFAVIPMMLVSLLLLANAQLDFSKVISALRTHYGEEAGLRGERWRTLIETNRGKEELQQLELVNDYFNGFLFANDDVVWQQEDYWATPVEFIGRAAGDCEDFTIAKYYSLLEMGFDASKLRLMYVKAVTYNQHHMVLTYYPKRGAIPLVLDNIDPVIKPATQRGDLIPIYSFDADYLWLAKARGDGKLVGDSSRLSLWRDLRQRQSQYLQGSAPTSPGNTN
ncbi:transglutaminase-like cysteine peptidase [Neiella marina]|uniref:Transglutaminase-like cysteine peptidase n=1 Tax=Neiella holothuriorum TaxID=2870530 RepID=A0ABS7EK71_9GAMM|nr:transglutaminase-like cysteine peptidase [Neiella holothuriorum]MBW8192067.1 transglutaminase-like cysteine peptidase [Neiella holothuriorum]